MFQFSYCILKRFRSILNCISISVKQILTQVPQTVIYSTAVLILTQTAIYSKSKL